MASVTELVELLEKLPANSEVKVLVREVAGFGSATVSIEDLDLTPLDGLNPEVYDAENVECLSTEHIRIKDTRKVNGMAPLHRKVVVTLGGEIEK